MYEVFENLCKEKGVTPYRVAADTGISQVTLSDWKKGRSTPKIDKLLKISEYFGVEVNLFLTAIKS